MKLLLSLVFLLPVLLFAQSKKPLTVDDLWAMKRIGSFNLSPDGKTIVFSVSTYSMNENKGNTDIYLVNSDGTGLRALKSSEKNESSPVFMPDGSMNPECVRLRILHGIAAWESNQPMTDIVLTEVAMLELEDKIDETLCKAELLT